jgi:hypothetical protein
MSFTCPACQRTSYNPNDAQHGYCAACCAFTGARTFTPAVVQGVLAPGPEPAQATVMVRVLGKRGAPFGRETMRDIGTRAANRFRELYHRDPPRVLENHPELSAEALSVFCYPGAFIEILDEAIDAFSQQETAYGPKADPRPQPCECCGAPPSVTSPVVPGAGKAPGPERWLCGPCKANPRPLCGAWKQLPRNEVIRCGLPAGHYPARAHQAGYHSWR